MAGNPWADMTADFSPSQLARKEAYERLCEHELFVREMMLNDRLLHGSFYDWARTEDVRLTAAYEHADNAEWAERVRLDNEARIPSSMSF